MQGHLATMKSLASSAEVPDEVAATNTFKEDARRHGEDVVSFWAETMADEEKSIGARLMASKLLAAYGFGLPRQTISLQSAVVDPNEKRRLHEENRQAVERATRSALTGLGVKTNGSPLIGQPTPASNLPPDYVHVMPGTETEETRRTAAIVSAAVSAAVNAGRDSITIEPTPIEKTPLDDSSGV